MSKQGGQHSAMGMVQFLSLLAAPLFQAILRLGLKLTNLTHAWDRNIVVKDPGALSAIVLKGDLGLGEAFMNGQLNFAVSSAEIKPSASSSSEKEQPGKTTNKKEDLEAQSAAALAFFRAAVDPATSKIYSFWMVPIAHVYVVWAFFADWCTNLQSVSRSQAAIASHYDRSTKAIECMTAPSMVYTCGHWGPDCVHNLEEAQRAKMALVAEKMCFPRRLPNSPAPTITVLDIGCGYGALGKFLTDNYNVKCTGISISSEQVAWANKHVCNDRLSVVFTDYRTMPQEWEFDAIVSVGMFEAVGPRNYVEFFRVHERHLKPNGLVLLHTITQPFSTRVNLSPWLIKYIFPDGTLPSLQQVFGAAEKVLVPEDMHQFGPDYAKTLEAWRHNWLAREDSELPAEANNPRFRRMWWLYLTLCQALFEVRHTNLTQFVFSKRGLRSSAKILDIRAASSRINDVVSGPPKHEKESSEAKNGTATTA